MKIAIVGAGPAGLRAAEVAAEHAQNEVSVFDAKPSSGRKFLIAGKNGLNLTNDENWETFLTRYSGHDLPNRHWQDILNQFDQNALRTWAASLGIETFAASSGKVFPVSMKAAPLLRRWIERLRRLNISFHFNHRFIDFDTDKNISFEHRGENVTERFDLIIFALGGGSWKSTGSDGHWVRIFEKHGIRVSPLRAANCGWGVDWHADVLAKAEGLPMKNIAISAGEERYLGELVITRYGLEGGPIYRLGPAIRSLDSPQIQIDFKPTFSEQKLIAKMESAKKNYLHEAKLRWKLNPAALAILSTYPEWKSAADLAHTVKRCTITLTQTRPIDEAISSAGGIKWTELNSDLSLKKLPHIFCAGEMLDWEAPTGGYLLQACFATGTYVGNSCTKRQE